MALLSPLVSLPPCTFSLILSSLCGRKVLRVLLLSWGAWGEACICGLAEALQQVRQKTLGSANRKSTTNYKSANHKKDWFRKSQIREVPHLPMVRKSNKLFMSDNLRICNLQNFFELWRIFPSVFGQPMSGGKRWNSVKFISSHKVYIAHSRYFIHWN